MTFLEKEGIKEDRATVKEWKIYDTDPQHKGSFIHHYVVKCGEYGIDPTIVQFYDLEVNDMEIFKRKWNVVFKFANKGCVYDLINGHRPYQDFQETLTEQPYFIGKYGDHPLYELAKETVFPTF